MRAKDFFFKVKTHKIITWRGKIVLAVGALMILWLCRPIIQLAVTNYIYHVDDIQPASRIVVENWDGSIDIFEQSLRAAAMVGATEIGSIIYQDSFNDWRKKHAYMLNAWSAGIDTNNFFLIPTPRKDPKTLNIARAVLDTAHSMGWTNLTIVTFDLHSARSGKSYRLAAKPFNITVHIMGIPLEEVTSKNWTTSNTGIAMAFSELLKKLYYDIIVF
jgi:hypothetical protein